MKKFNELKQDIRQRKQRAPGYWTKERCKLLAENYGTLPVLELRKMFDGYSNSAIRKQVGKRRKAGCEF